MPGPFFTPQCAQRSVYHTFGNSKVSRSPKTTPISAECQKIQNSQVSNFRHTYYTKIGTYQVREEKHMNNSNQGPETTGRSQGEFVEGDDNERRNHWKVVRAGKTISVVADRLMTKTEAREVAQFNWPDRDV